MLTLSSLPFVKISYWTLISVPIYVTAASTLEQLNVRIVLSPIIVTTYISSLIYYAGYIAFQVSCPSEIKLVNGSFHKYRLGHIEASEHALQILIDVERQKTPPSNGDLNPNRAKSKALNSARATNIEALTRTWLELNSGKSDERARNWIFCAFGLSIFLYVCVLLVASPWTVYQYLAG